MKRMLSVVICLALLMTIPAGGSIAEEGSGFTFGPEELTLQAFVQAMLDEHAKRHTFAEGKYGLGNDITAHIKYPTGTPMTLMSCLEYRDNDVRESATKTQEINDLFGHVFLMEQGLSLEPTEDNPLDVEKLDQKYNRNVYLGVAQPGWWRVEISEDATLLMVPVMITDAKKSPLEDTVYVMCIEYSAEGTWIWFCADSYIAYTMITAAMPANVKAKDEFKLWWDSQEDYREGVAASPGTEAAWRLAYADALRAHWTAE